MATLDHDEFTTDDNLKIAFDKFDSDHTKTITAQEIKDLLGCNKSIKADVIKAIIKEVDTNGDGKVSFKEFVAMMKKSIV